MSEQEQVGRATPAPQSDHDVLVEIRDLLEQLLDAVNAIERGR